MKFKILCFTAIGLSCCTQSEESTEAYPTNEFVTTEAVRMPEIPATLEFMDASATMLAPQRHDQKLIRRASLTLEVQDVSKAYDSIKEIIKAFHGYASNEEKTNNGKTAEQQIDIRVEEKFFDEVIDRVSSLAKKVESRNITVRDVTGQYADIAARLKTKRDVEVRYTEILHQARTVKDMLAIEEQLGIVREEIESMEANIKVMADQIAYCSIAIEFSEHIVTNDPTFGSRVAVSLQRGWNDLITLVIGLITLWPFLIGACAMWIFVSRLLRRKRKVEDQIVA